MTRAPVPLLLALALALTLAAPALAATPHISEISPDEDFPGAVIVIVGTNFSDAKEDCEVFLGEASAFVLDATPESLKVIVPNEVKPGKVKVRVKIGKDRSNDKEFRILNPADEEALAKKKEEDLIKAEGAGGGGDTPSTAEQIKERQKKRLRFLDPKRFPEDGREDGVRVVDARGSIRFDVKGRAALPDGCMVTLKLVFDSPYGTATQIEREPGAGPEANPVTVTNVANIPVDVAEATVQTQTFQATFGPYSKKLFSGNYYVEARFEIDQQPLDIKYMFEREVKDRMLREALSNLFDRTVVQVGQTAAAQREVDEVRRHFLSSLRKADALVVELEESYAATMRSGFLKDGKVDESGWEDWLAKRPLFRKLSTEERARKARTLKAERRYLHDDGKFNDVAWREWIDNRFRGDVLTLAKEHVAYRDGYQVLIFPGATTKLSEMYGLLISLSMMRSSEIYERNGLKVAQADQTPIGTDVVSLPATVRQLHFEELKRAIMKEVGIRTLD